MIDHTRLTERDYVALARLADSPDFEVVKKVFSILNQVINRDLRRLHGSVLFQCQGAGQIVEELEGLFISAHDYAIDRKANKKKF